MADFIRYLFFYSKGEDNTGPDVYISIVMGEILEVIKSPLDQNFRKAWLYGRTQDGREGWFPGDFVAPFHD